MIKSPHNKSEFLGLSFDNLDCEEVCNIVLQHTSTRKFKYIVTPNVQHMVDYVNDPEKVGPIYQSAWKVLCDSRVLRNLGYIVGKRLSVVTGSDLTPRLLQRASERNIEVSVIGPSESDVAKLREIYPNLHIFGHSPPFGFEDSDEQLKLCLDFVLDADADLIFLALGTPRQEYLATYLSIDPDVRGICLCIGASIDFITGKQKRAPQWMQKLSIEWLHRLSMNPGRLWRRYLIDCPKIFLVVSRSAINRMIS